MTTSTTGEFKSAVLTIQLGIVIQSRPDADQDRIMHGSHPVGHEHALRATQKELSSALPSYLSIQGLGKRQSD